MERRTTGAIFFAVLALGLVAACGDDAEETPGTDAGIQTDAATDGGSNNDSATSTDAGPTPVTCGGQTCEAAPILFDNEAINILPACCVQDACGLDVTPAAQYEVTVPDSCVLPRAPGELDEECPTYEYRFPLVNGVTDFVGCCLPSGRCGVRADLSSLTLFDENMSIEYTLVLEDFGCQEAADWFVDAPAEPGSCTP